MNVSVTAEATAATVQATGGKAIAVKADVSKAADCEAMVAAAEKEYGKLTVLFNDPTDPE